LLRLYDYVLSDRCYRVRLMLGLLGLEYERRAVDFFPGKEHRSAGFLALNPAGDLPVLDDDGLILRDAQAILCHLVNRFDRCGAWLPRDPARFGPVMMWLAFAGGDLEAVCSARLVAMLGAAGNLDVLQTNGRAALRALEDHMTDRSLAGGEWVVGETPTVADIALFPAVALSHDSGIGLEDYPALNLWQRRVRRLPGFVSMPGIPDYF